MAYDPAQPVPLVLAKNDFEAQIIAQALRDEEIPASVAGGHTQMLFGGANPLAPVTVMVRRDHRMLALRVLRRIRAEAQGLTIDDDVPLRAVTDTGHCVVCAYDMTGLPHSLTCPECGTNLADDSSLFQATTAGGMLSSKALRILIVAILALLLFAGLFGRMEFIFR